MQGNLFHAYSSVLPQEAFPLPNNIQECAREEMVFICLKPEERASSKFVFIEM